ncbi:MAG: hypothetical protein RL220_268 [Bacteroidota bacterium]
MAEKKKRGLLLKKLKSRFRLTVLNERTFEEKFSYSLTPMNVIVMFGGLLIVFGSLIYLLVAFTPLKRYVVPDCEDYVYREDARRSRMMIDSLMAEMDSQEKYLANLRVILSGGVVQEGDSVPNEVQQGDLSAGISDLEQDMRNRTAAEDRYTLEADQDRRKQDMGVLLYKPVNGTVSGHFDPKQGHFGIDLVGPKEEPVRAVLDGTVIAAAFTADGGNVIQIQHSNNMVSVYKHNSALLKKLGDPVKAGESIAFIGDSGEHSDGPHLHFELWVNGIPVNPMDYLAIR